MADYTSFMLYLRLQYKLLIFLIATCVLPLVAAYLYLPFEVPKIYLFFLTFLIGLRISFYKDKPFRATLNKTVGSELLKEKGKPASKNEIVSRIEAHISGRDLMFGIVGVIILITTAVMGKL